MGQCPYGKNKVNLTCLVRKCKFVRVLYFIDESTPILACILMYDSEVDRQQVEKEALKEICILA